LVLGSASPRRRELLASLKVPFVVCSAQADESAVPFEDPDEYLARVVRAKLDAVRAQDLGPSAGVLVADTIVIAPDGDMLGKPRDANEAAGMVRRLGGATHRVSTRFLLAEREDGSAPVHDETVTTRVTFRSLAPGEAAAYASTGEGMDKAGGYALQGGAAAFVERVHGSHTAVVGLPLGEVAEALRGLGWI